MKLNEVKKGKSVADLGIEYRGGSFDCSYNNLTSLKGAPQEVNGSFDCYGNHLTSLEGAPQKVGGYFECSSNELTSLKGAPRKVGGYFDCSHNELTSLAGAPQEVDGHFWCNNNNGLISLKDIHRHIHRINGEFDASKCPIQSHVLGLLLIKDLKRVNLDNKKVKAIISAHLAGGSMRSAMDCQHELIKAGFPEYAKL